MRSPGAGLPSCMPEGRTSLWGIRWPAGTLAGLDLCSTQHTHTHSHTHTHTHTHTQTHKHTHTHINYSYTHTHNHFRTYTHTCPNTYSPLLSHTSINTFTLFGLSVLNLQQHAVTSRAIL